MLRILLLLAIAFATSAEARQRKTKAEARHRIADENVRLRVLPMGGGQSTVDASICSLFSSELAGNYLCLKGDGTSVNQSLTATGSPVTTTTSVCPNGANCGAVTHQYLAGATQQSWTTANVATPAGDFSVCAVVRHDLPIASTVDETYLTKSTNSTTDLSFVFRADARLAMIVWKDDATSSTASGTAAAITGWHLVCGTYDFVADGTSVIRVFQDGVEQGAGNTAAVGPAQAKSTTGFRIGYWFGTRYFKGGIREVIYTEKVLTPATMLAMANHALGKLSGSYAQPITVTRASATSCANSSGSELTVLLDNRPCVRKSGVEVWGAATSLVPRSEEIDNASWTKQEATVTADNAIAPDGSKTADLLTDNANNNQHRAYQGALTVVTATAYTMSVYAKAGTASWIMLSGFNNTFKATFNLTTGAVGSILGAGTTATITGFAGGWLRCTISYTTSYTTEYVTVNMGTSEAQANAASYVGSGSTVYIWGAQLETGSFASPYIRTTTATATRAADQVTVVNPLAVDNPASWCIGATFNGSVFNTATGNGILQFGTFADNNTISLYTSNGASALLGFVVFDATGGTKFVNGTTVLASGLRRVRACNDRGTLRTWIDGRLQPANAGTGTGLITTMPATIRLGALSATSAPLGGEITDICIGTGADSCQ